MKFVDSHCHLDSQEFDPDRDAVIQRALDAGVECMVAVGTGNGPPDLETGVRLADSHDAFYATAGIHPHDAAKANDESLRRLAELVKHPKVIAIGEIGLDYHYDFSPRETQRAIFIEQLRIARDAAIPVVIHTREAWDDTFAILRGALRRRAAGRYALLHRWSQGGPPLAGSRFSSQLRRHRDVPEGAGRATGGARGAARSDAD